MYHTLGTEKGKFPVCVLAGLIVFAMPKSMRARRSKPCMQQHELRTHSRRKTVDREFPTFSSYTQKLDDKRLCFFPKILCCCCCLLVYLHTSNTLETRGRSVHACMVYCTAKSAYVAREMSVRCAVYDSAIDCTSTVCLILHNGQVAL